MDHRPSESEKPSVEQSRSAAKTPVVVVLDNVRSLHNIGSVFRTADAFLIQAIYLCGISGCPPHREIEKTALGATGTVEWKYFKNTSEAVAALNSLKAEIWGVEQDAQSIFLHEFKPEKDKLYGLILGNEVKGVDRDIIRKCKGTIEIPQVGVKHSLNVAVSAGIVLWDFYRKIKL